MPDPLTFPPLLWGEEALSDAFDHAVMKATLGCDAGLVTYKIGLSRVEAAMVFAPEVPIDAAMVMLPLCATGFQNALGALAPPEVAVHLEWSGGIRLNGASCGRFRVKAAETTGDAPPAWLVVGFELPLRADFEDTGHTPDQTALYEEGCADVAPDALVEAWARHTLSWIARWEESGGRAIHAEWRGLAHGVGEPAERGQLSGTFLGVDENFGMLLRDDTGTHLVPLTDLLEANA